MAVFVDTGAWFAASVPGDPDHAAAAAFMRSNNEPLVTSDYVYDELLTLFRSRGEMERGKDWIARCIGVVARLFELLARMFEKRLTSFSLSPIKIGASPIAPAAW